MITGGDESPTLVLQQRLEGPLEEILFYTAQNRKYLINTIILISLTLILSVLAITSSRASNSSPYKHYVTQVHSIRMILTSLSLRSKGITDSSFTYII